MGGNHHRRGYRRLRQDRQRAPDPLQPNEFYKYDIGKWTKSDVLVNFGRPEETSYYPLMKREVWTYRYLEDNVWYMMYSFYFDDQGILNFTQKSPDPLHDQDRRSFF